MDINSDHQNNTLKENTNLFLPQDQKILHNYNSNKDILNELMQNQRKNLIEKKLNEISNKKNIKIESNPKLLDEVVDCFDHEGLETSFITRLETELGKELIASVIINIEDKPSLSVLGPLLNDPLQTWNLTLHLPLLPFFS